MLRSPELLSLCFSDLLLPLVVHRADTDYQHPMEVGPPLKDGPLWPVYAARVLLVR